MKKELLICLLLLSPLLSYQKEGEVKAIITCHDTTAPDNKCAMLSIPNVLPNIYHCSKTDSMKTYCFDFKINPEQLQLDGNCLPRKQFYSESCQKDEDCYTMNCKNNTCQYKEDGQECENSKECGLKSYCDHENYQCKKYRTLNQTCEYNEGECSPDLFCTYIVGELYNKCTKKGQLDNYEPTQDRRLCKSFHTEWDDYYQGDVCSGHYEPNDINHQIESVLFQQVEWDDDTVKLSDREGINYGLGANFDNYTDQFIEKYKIALGSDTACLRPVIREFLVGQAFIEGEEKFLDISLTDEEAKKLLEKKDDPIVSGMNIIKVGLGLFISLLILL